MRRRELLKGITLIAGGALSPLPAWSMAAPDTAPDDLPLAAPVRGLISKNGKLLQPIEIFLPHAGPATQAVISVDGQEISRKTLSSGLNTFSIAVPPVDTAKDVKVDVLVNGELSTRTVRLEPVRKVKVYVLPHSHHDLGYTDLQADVEEKQMNNILRGIELAEKTAHYPEGSRFIWNLEVLWGADLFMRRKSSAEKARFIEAVKKGWIALNGMYANELTGLCRPVELLELFRYSGELGAQCGVKVDSAMASDVPGFTWGTVTAMSQAGIRYFSTAPNFFDRIGRLMVEWQDKPFWWVSRSGKERVLVWIPWTGYALSHVMKLDHQWVGRYQDRLDSVSFPYDISYMRWSGHGDNAAPDPELSEFIKSWNSEFEWPKFVISSTSTAFSDFEKNYGQTIPTYKGDLTPYWEDGAASSALETGMNRVAADRLTQAATLHAMFALSRYQPAEFNEAWRNILLYSEHTWGAWCSVSNSESPFTTKQWDVKRQFSVEGDKQSTSLIDRILQTSSAAADTSVIEVHNTTSWPRNELTLLSKELSAAGDHVRDDHGKPVPSQRLSTGELALWVDALPPFSSRRYHLSQAAPHAPITPVAVKSGTLKNSLIQIEVDPSTGNISGLKLHGRPENFIDSGSGEQANEYLFFEGNDITKVQKSGPVEITEEDAGPLVATLRIVGSAPGCNHLTRRIRLVAGAAWAEISNTIDKKRAPINSVSGKGGPGDEFAQRGSKESLQFAFPFNVSGGKMRMDIPLAEMRPELDQLQGTSKNWLPVGRWIDVSNETHGVTWVTLDAPLVEIGELSANLLGSQRDPLLWREYIAPTQKFYSWAMNNHWGTNYRAYQEGLVEFRYVLHPHLAYSAADATKFATGFSQPLLSSHPLKNPVSPPLPQLDSEDVIVLEIKPSEDQAALIVKLYGASGKDRKAKLTWAHATPPRLFLSDTNESAIKRIEGNEIEVKGWDLITIRAELS